jgi:hypothetical protein
LKNKKDKSFHRSVWLRRGRRISIGGQMRKITILAIIFVILSVSLYSTSGIPTTNNNSKGSIFSAITFDVDVRVNNVPVNDVAIYQIVCRRECKIGIVIVPPSGGVGTANFINGKWVETLNVPICANERLYLIMHFPCGRFFDLRFHRSEIVKITHRFGGVGGNPIHWFQQD